MTESSFASASTATPPKLLDADLNFGGSDLDGFGNMFESFGKRRSRALDGQGITLLPNTASPVDQPPRTIRHSIADNLSTGINLAIKPSGTSEIIFRRKVSIHTFTNKH